jgi:DNA-binding IclR family transcriptional regulator
MIYFTNNVEAVSMRERVDKTKDVASGGAATLRRGLEILRCFARSNVALGSSEIARLTGFSQPTAWRICQTLLQEGYLVADARDGKMRPGLPVLALGYAALEASSLADLVRPYLEALSQDFKCAAAFAIRDRLDMLFVQRCEVDAILTLNVRAGSRVPIATTATGWAYIAGLSSDERRRFTDRHLRDLDPAVRARWDGVVADYDRTGVIVSEGLFVPNLNTAAVPLGRLRNGEIYVLTCSGASSIVTRLVLTGALSRALLIMREKFDEGLARLPAAAR